MQKMSRFAILLLLSITAVSAFASGGACPSGVPVTGNNCYFIAANGSDSNAGTSGSSPWQHAPGMPACTGTCASVTPGPGMGFIFRGGDTWHMGASTVPATGGTWAWSWSGSSGSPIYIGVDQAWFTGSSWARPIFTGDNPTSTSVVASCAHQVGGANQLFVNGNDYVTYDNFELTGLCQNDTGAPFSHDIYFVHSGGNNNTYERLYLHGWSHVSFKTGDWNMWMFLGSNGVGDSYFQDVIDGSDSDPTGAGTSFGGCYNVSQSVFNNVVGFVCTKIHSFHDNLLQNLTQPGDGAAHGNVMESSGEFAGNNLFYNNVMRNVCLASGCTVVNLWPEPGVGYTDYFFNNVEYNTGGINGNYFDVGQNANSGNQGTVNSFNNTWQNAQDGAIMTCASGGFAEPLNLANNHYITNAGSAYVNCPGSTTMANELLQSQSTASGQGYSSSTPFGFSPVSASTATVGAGTNLTSTYCSALSASGDSLVQAAGKACQSDTTYAVSYNTSNHTVSWPARASVPRPSSGAWNIGAYQYGTPPGAPTNVQAAAQPKVP